MIRGIFCLLSGHEMRDWEDSPSVCCEQIRICKRCGTSEPRKVHCWEETSRDALGWDGGDSHSGKGQYWFRVHYVCSKCGEINSEETI